MRYLIAILIPPLGLLLCGKFFQAILCAILIVATWFHFWPLGSIWAFFIAFNWYAEKRNRELIRDMRRGG